MHLVLGPGLGPARMTSAALAGLAACYLVYDLTCLWFGDRRGTLAASAVYLVSRTFYFPATTARPDMTAVAFGLLAVREAVCHRRDPCRRHLVVGGVAAGLSLLAHPFGIVPAVQVGLACFAEPAALRATAESGDRFLDLALLVFAPGSP